MKFKVGDYVRVRYTQTKQIGKVSGFIGRDIKLVPVSGDWSEFRTCHECHQNGDNINYPFGEPETDLELAYKSVNLKTITDFLELKDES